MSDTITATQVELAAAFTEWERRYREEPDRFQSDVQRLKETAKSYGDLAAPHLIKILNEQRGVQ